MIQSAGCGRAWPRTRLRPDRRFRDNDRTVAPARPNGLMHSAFLVRNNIRHRRDIEDAYLKAIEHAQFEIILAKCIFPTRIEFSPCACGSSRAGGPGGFAVARKDGSPTVSLCLACPIWKFSGMQGLRFMNTERVLCTPKLL